MHALGPELGFVIAAAAGIAAVGFNVHVTCKLWMDGGYTTPQKLFQTLLTWAIPGMGALLVGLALASRTGHLFQAPEEIDVDDGEVTQGPSLSEISTANEPSDSGAEH